MDTVDTQPADRAGFGLGGRLPLLAPDDMTERQRLLYADLAPAKRLEAAKGGFVAEAPGGALIGPFNSYFYVPEIARGYIAWIEAQHTHLPFPAEVREAVILTVGAAWNAPFEIYAHRAMARTAGLAPKTTEALVNGREPDGLSREVSLARTFTQALVTGHEVDDGLYAKAQAAFGNAGLVALTHLIGLYLSVSVVLKAFRIPAPHPATQS